MESSRRVDTRRMDGRHKDGHDESGNGVAIPNFRQNNLKAILSFNQRLKGGAK
jgi:hypothetical protein